MATSDQAMGSPAELGRLTGVERGFAQRRYLSWMKLTNNAGLSADDQRLQAINVAYISVARLWLAIAGPIGFAAGCMWSFRDSTTQITIATALTILAAGPLTLLIVRWKQAHQYWHEVVRPPRRSPAR